MRDIIINLTTLEMHASEVICTRLVYNKSTRRCNINVGTSCKENVRQVDIYIDDKLIDTLNNIKALESQSSSNFKLRGVKEIKLIVYHTYGKTDIVLTKCYIDSIRNKIKTSK